jgi:GNAT superfamily N-acetyltransferase
MESAAENLHVGQRSNTGALTRATVTLDIAIRAATAEDLPGLEWMGLFSSHRAMIGSAFAAQQRGDGLMLLAVVGGFPVGQVWIDFAWRSGGPAILWAVRTFHPLRGSGIGRLLMMAAEEDLSRRGIARAELMVDVENLSARRFYSRLGWRLKDRRQEDVPFITLEGTVEVVHLDVWAMSKRVLPLAKT